MSPSNTFKMHLWLLPRIGISERNRACAFDLGTQKAHESLGEKDESTCAIGIHAICRHVAPCKNHCTTPTVWWNYCCGVDTDTEGPCMVSIRSVIPGQANCNDVYPTQQHSRISLCWTALADSCNLVFYRPPSVGQCLEAHPFREFQERHDPIIQMLKSGKSPSMQLP
jgi:hypothetical protein